MLIMSSKHINIMFGYNRVTREQKDMRLILLHVDYASKHINIMFGYNRVMREQKDRQLILLHVDHAK